MKKMLNLPAEIPLRYFELFASPLIKIISKALEMYNTDRYRKKLSAEAHLRILIFHTMSDNDSARETSQDLSHGYIQRLCKIPEGISLSQFCRANQRRDWHLFEYTFSQLVFFASRHIQGKENLRELRKIRIFDSTFIEISKEVCLLAKRGYSGDYDNLSEGIKLHFCFAPYEENIQKVIVTSGNVNDSSQFAKLAEGVLDTDTIALMDRGYTNYQRFASLKEEGLLFLARLKKNARYEVLKIKDEVRELRDIEKKITLIADLIVNLGKGTSQVKEIRVLIYHQEGAKHHLILVTNLFSEEAETIYRLYLTRWKIELFFRWLKQQLKIARFIGESTNAILIQIYSVLIYHLLLLILKSKLGAKHSLLWVHRWMKKAYYLTASFPYYLLLCDI